MQLRSKDRGEKHTSEIIKEELHKYRWKIYILFWGENLSAVIELPLYIYIYKLIALSQQDLSGFL